MVSGGSSAKQIISQFAFNVFALIDVPILFGGTQVMDDRKEIDKKRRSNNFIEFVVKKKKNAT